MNKPSKDQTRGFRPLPHQTKALERLEQLNPHLNISALIRRGLDLAIIEEAERLTREGALRGVSAVASALDRAEQASNGSKISQDLTMRSS